MTLLRLPLLDQPWVGRQPARPCPVCGRPWFPWHGSRLPCHAKCLLTKEGAVVALAPDVGHAEAADRLGVPAGVVAATWRHRRLRL